MPPRYAYWTILIDGKATAFRAREREELLPTFNQLARKNADIAMRYFARGHLWDNPEQAQWANRNPAATRPESRNRDWRPGGEHKDPRARFEKKHREKKPEGRFAQERSRERSPLHQKPWQARPTNRPLPRPEGDRPPGSGKFHGKPFRPGDRRDRPKWEGKQTGEGKAFRPSDQRDRPKWDEKRERKPFQSKDRPERPKWQAKPGEKPPFKPSDRREPRSDERAGKRPGRWNGPPKRKPR